MVMHTNARREFHIPLHMHDHESFFIEENNIFLHEQIVVDNMTCGQPDFSSLVSAACRNKEGTSFWPHQLRSESKDYYVTIAACYTYMFMQ